MPNYYPLPISGTMPTIAWRRETVDASAGVYKLVGHVTSSNGVKDIMTALNFDNTVIQPVHFSNYSDVTVTDKSTEWPMCLEPKLKYSSGWGENLYSMEFISYVSGDRTALEFTEYYNQATTSTNPDTDYAAFYYKVKSGKTVDAETFKLASLAPKDPIAAAVVNANNEMAVYYERPLDNWHQWSEMTSVTLNAVGGGGA